MITSLGRCGGRRYPQARSTATGSIAYLPTAGAGSPTPQPEVSTTIFWGANPYKQLTRAERKRREHEERVAMGILPAPVAAVVRKVAANPVIPTSEERENALRMALEERHIAYVERYAAALERLAALEKKRREDEEEEIVLLLALLH